MNRPRSDLLPMISLLSLLTLASACDLTSEGGKTGSADGAVGYPNSGWIDLDPTSISRICPPAAIAANQPYDLLVKFQASCWGIELNASCTASLDGQAVKLSIAYAHPSWAADTCYCEREITCTLPPLPAGSYNIEPTPYCAPGAVRLEVGTNTGAPVCSATTGCP